MTNSIVKLGLISALLGAALVVGSANAASKCKGLENAACKANASCGWVNGYERKDGRKVSSFCRANSKSKGKDKSTAAVDLRQDQAGDLGQVLASTPTR